jgi:nucleoside-diphosphate-sugar epimerase
MSPSQDTLESHASTKHLKEIAIVGASGTIGSHIVSALLAKNTFNITAISRADSKATFPPSVQRHNIDYTDPTTIISALRGKDALIITMNVYAAKDTSSKLIRAAADAGVPWILPNEYGMYNTEEAQNDTIGNSKTRDRQLIEELGMSWIGITCGFWYEHSLSLAELYGFDITKREVTFFDDGMQRLNTSTWNQVGRGVTAILSLPLMAGDEGLTLEFYRNRMAFVSSFALSQRDMLESLKRVTGTTDGDWKIERVEAKKRFEEAKEEMKRGNRAAFGRALYTRYFYDDAGLFERNHGLDNERLGLPVEDLDEATKRAVKLQESGYWDSYGKH